MIKKISGTIILHILGNGVVSNVYRKINELNSVEMTEKIINDIIDNKEVFVVNNSSKGIEFFDFRVSKIEYQKISNLCGPKKDYDDIGLVYQIESELNVNKIKREYEENNNKAIEDIYLNTYCVGIVFDQAIELIKLIALASNLALPGSFRIHQIYSIYDQNIFNKGGSFDQSFLDYIDAADFYNAIERIELTTCWKWLSNHLCENNEIENTNIGRTIGCYSRLFTEDQDLGNEMQIIWAMAGIESIYCRNNLSVKNQLIEKIPLLLKIDNLNTKINKMYEFRSNFLHGDVYIPLRQHSFINTQKANKFNSDFFNTESNAICILLCTLQKLIKNNWKSIDFAFTINGITNS